jgi:hypothetical protein
MKKTESWGRNYHESYLQQKSQFDPRVFQLISTKEEIIISSPFSSPLLKHIPYKVHRFKGGKIRILYALSTEAPSFWDSPPESPEIMFLFADLRSDETYNDALKILKKMMERDGKD